MRWNFKPVSLLKQFAAGISVVTMCISPVAEGAAAANQKKLINQYLKETALTTKKMTVGEFWRMVRHVYPATLQKQMDQWVALNHQEMMPSVEATSFKDADGKEQVRLTLSKDGQSTSLTFTGDEENPLKVNGVSFTKKELLNYNSFNDLAGKMAKQDPIVGKALKTGAQPVLGKNSVLTFKEYKSLTSYQKAEYLIRLRLAMESAQRVYKVIYGAQAYNEINKKYEWVLQYFFGEEAQAAGTGLTGKPCIVAGYLSIYGESGSCGGSSQGALDLKAKMRDSQASCANNGVACNPMVYGFDQGGGAYCVSRSEVKYATRVCNSKSPLQNADPKKEGENKKRIIESYLKKVKNQDINLKLNDEGKISEEQYAQISSYLGDLQTYINSAIAECGQAPLKDIQKKREDQVSACEEIKTRAFSLQSFAANPEPPGPPGPLPNPGEPNCNDKMPGSVAGPDGKCVCAEGSKEGEIGEGDKKGPGCVVVDAGGSGDLPGGKDTPPIKGEDSSCGFWCRNKNWIIPVGIGALALGLFWWITNKDSKAKNNSPVYIPPAPVPEPTATTSPTVTPAPTVEPPPVVVPPPTPTTTEGGSKTDSPGRAGGVR
ncbi:MAG: hypothetical protein KUL82_13890 [Bdellovibrio sp.]|nr:hypothetical protein [Bdellovibrio sp.]